MSETDADPKEEVSAVMRHYVNGGEVFSKRDVKALVKALHQAEQERDDARRQLEAVRAAYNYLMDYRKRNTLNFQLEKMDDKLRILGQALDGEIDQ